MPETPQETVNRVYREFKRYTGDGLPNEPVGAPLPIGDPASGLWNPKKSHIREAGTAVLEGAEQSASDAAESADSAGTDADRAQSYAAMLSADKIKFATVPTLLADEVMSYTAGEDIVEVGPGDIIEAQGFRYEVAASDATDAHVETAGGVKLMVLTHYKRLYSAAFGLEPDTEEDVTVLAQKVIDALPSDKGITLVIPAGRYKVSKNTTLANYPGNDQPCLEFRDKKHFRVEAEGAVFYCETHAQGVFEFQLCEDGEIVGLKAEGAGNFPPLDGTTGRGEKGISSAGYNTTSGSFPGWGIFKNNSFDTSGETGGGFGGNFPQWGGGTAPTWGVWNGGYIGNQGSGFLLHNGCKRIVFNRCSATEFNGMGMSVGFIGDIYPINPASSETWERNKIIRSVDCNWDGNYDGGVTYLAVDGFLLTGGTTSENGHPDSVLSDDNYDPGYGSAARSLATAYADFEDLARNVTVTKVHAKNNKRKGIDVHSGDTFVITANLCDNNAQSGIAAIGGGASGWPASNIIVSENTIKGSALEAAIAFSKVIGGDIYSNFIDSLGLDVTTGILTGNNSDNACTDVSVHDNRVKIGGEGRAYQLLYANGACYNNRWEGGTDASFIKPINKSSFAIPDLIAFDVTFNGTSAPAISNVTGTNQTPVASSITNGVRFTFPDDITNTGLQVSVNTELKSSGGLTVSGGPASVFYTRAVIWPVVDLGIKISIGGTDIQASNITGGGMRVSLSLH